MFTTNVPPDVRREFTRQLSQVLATVSAGMVTFLFCIREDYLPDLYDLSKEIREVFARDNTYRLHNLDRNNGREVLKRASELGKASLAPELVDRIIDDLCRDNGTVYPPYLQIVGYKL